MYLAKNQDKYNFNLSSSDFMLWSGFGYSAYTTAFKELVTEGYLIQKEGTEDIYTFFDKSRIPREEEKEKVMIEIPKEKAEEIQKLLLSDEFSF